MGLCQILKKGRDGLKYQLDKSVIKSEFPNLELQSKHHKKVAFTLKGGQDVVIGKEKENGDYDSELYEFSNVDDELVWPSTPSLPNYWAKVDFSSWNGVVDSNFRDDFNKDGKQIQLTLNALIDYETDQRNYFAQLQKTLSDSQSFILKLINFSVAKYMHDEVETKYYKKEDVDKKIESLQAQIDNLNNAVSYKPDGSLNSVFPPSYTGDKDINDKISDSKVRQRIENLNSLDMKGDNN